MRANPRRTTRLIGGTLAAAMALSASPFLGVHGAGAADPLPPLSRPTADGAFCEGAPEDHPFTDLGNESETTRDAILCLVATGLTTGRTATTYAPGQLVTRRQMAQFIERLADLLDELALADDHIPALPAYDGTPDFTDVGSGDSAATAIGRLSQADIVGGLGDGSFGVNRFVSRRQMAAFINRLQEYFTGTPFGASGDYFDDDEGDSGEGHLNALAQIGVFQGDGQGSVAPGAAISRRQMANVLLRAAEVYHSNGVIDRPFVDEADDEIDDTEAVTRVIDDRDAFETEGGRYWYDDEDEFQILDPETEECESVSLAVFEQNLSTGDHLLGGDDGPSEYVPSSDDGGDQSTFCIDDLGPTPVDDLTATVTDVDTIELEWTGEPDDTQVFDVQVAEGAIDAVDLDEDFTDLGTVEAVDDETDYGLVAEDLEADTTYTFAVTAEADGDVAEAVLVEATTADDVATVDNAELRFAADAAGEVTQGDIAELVFSEATELSGDGPVVATLEDEDGDEIVVHIYADPEAVPADDDDGETDAVVASSETDAETGVETLLVLLAEAPEDANDEGDDEITWPLTITGIDNLQDVDDDLPIDLDASEDLEVDDEGNTVEDPEELFGEEGNPLADLLDLLGLGDLFDGLGGV